MFGWHHRLSAHEFDQTPGDSEGEGSLEFCNPWGHKESDTTQLPTNNNECIINSLQPQILSTRHIYNLVLFPVWPSHFIISGAISNCPLLFPSSILDTFQPGVGAHLLVSYIFAFSYCSWGSIRKNTGIGCHFLFHWIIFCQNSSL